MKAPAKVVITGGGTAGWMTACLMAKHWPSSSITLIESADIGTIGVGEGSTPFLKQFFQTLGITESEWMPACDATYKVGIRFADWCSHADFGAYFHPFFTPLDIDNGFRFFDAVQQRRQGHPAAVMPQDYFVAAELVRQSRPPVPHQCPGDIDYAYHFDAAKLGRVLRDFAVARGVHHVVDTVTHVAASELTITSVTGEHSGEHHGDLFVDCSGFRGLLVKQTLHRTYHSYKDTLFNDAAVAVSTPACTPITPQTESRALKHGWMWQIPLTSRHGNGYVYCSEFCSPQEAESELRAELGNEATGATARHLRMDVGRLDAHWQGNCLAIGLSQGFIEPLEATALMLVQYSVQHAIDTWHQIHTATSHHAVYNKEINRMFDGIRDYIAAHYYLNNRNDSRYWQACREMRVPDVLAFLVEAWDQGRDFDAALNEVRDKLVYLKPSWYSIFAGMGRLPPQSGASPDPNVDLNALVKRYFV